ncbi:CHAT domain-containing protein [Chitinophaga sp. SYP-B3965]|uniref:CHAT domain-containing protein n=1 Tax=Chitinophaga sp. SYP-B3965 TaxID=2663120 RepID=UPI001299BC0E|nr:CHAT domain-containing protein [Chitinophaga sp. SYP-B3965]MRG48373.1 CHAT domain-containing protein [Chitinophaga sp. SYP-B3965]
MKTIIISFANSSEQPLKSITEEDEAIHTILNENNRGNFNIHRESYATVTNINSAFSVHGGNIGIFHYAGHASQTSLLFNDQEANGMGIAYQLQPSIGSGALKLVVLNGCSTGAQVTKLLELGVPAVIATSASINDTTAKIFGIELFRNLCQKRMTTRHAFTAALASAQTATKDPLGVDEPQNRALNIPVEKPREPFWGLFFKKADAVDVSPIPVETTQTESAYEPNLQLTQTIFTALVQDGNIPAQQLDERKKQEIIEDNVFQKTIMDVFPHPIAIQLKTLFAAEYGADALKKPGIKRLEQIGRVFHITTEFMGIIMISQLWELKITKQVTALPDEISDLMEKYFNLTIHERAVYNYSTQIKAIRKYIDTQPNVNYFVTELEKLREEDITNKPFGEACEYLSYIRSATYFSISNPNDPPMIQESEVPQLCLTAEEMLSVFFEKLGFLHRYTLTSIQNIRINKFRHDTSTEFDHQVVKLMNSNASHEVNYYLLAKHLDNSGVILTKQTLTVFNVERRQYRGEELAFLNLSPLVVDINSFESRSDRSNLVFYGQYSGDVFVFRNVSKPDDELNRVEININRKFGRTEQQEQGRYEAICKQLNAFKEFALHEIIVHP